MSKTLTTLALTATTLWGGIATAQQLPPAQSEREDTLIQAALSCGRTIKETGTDRTWECELLDRYIQHVEEESPTARESILVLLAMSYVHRMREEPR